MNTEDPKDRRKQLALVLTLAAMSFTFSAQPALSTPESEFEEGSKYYKVRNYRQALTHFEQALAEGNGSAPCYLGIANSQAALGNKNEAIRRFREVAEIFKGLDSERVARKALLQLDPHNRYVDPNPKKASEQKDQYIEQGKALLKQRQFANARKCFEFRLSKVPTDEEALYYRALCYHYEGNKTRATELYSQLATKSPNSEKGKLALQHLQTLSPNDAKKVASALPAASTDFISSSGKYKDKRIVITDEEYKKEYAAIPKQTEIALAHGVAAGDNALPATINGQNFLMRARRGQWESLMSLQDAKHARLTIPPGKPNGWEKNEFSEENIPVWKTSCEVTVGGIKRKVPLSIAEDNIGAPRLGSAFFEDLKFDGYLNKLVLSKSSGTAEMGKKAQIDAEKGEYETLPETAEIRFSPGDHDHMVIDAQVNGKPMKCMFDTGANELFTLNQLEQCGIKIARDKPPDGYARGWAGKPVPVWKATVPIKVGAMTRTLEVRASEEAATLPLIGQGFIRDFQYSIDRSGGRMTLYKKTSKLAKEQNKETHSLYDVPCTVENEREFVSVTVNGRSIGPILVDTGASNTIISRDHANAAGIEIPASAPTYAFGGVGGQITVRQVYVDLRLGPVQRMDFPVFVGNTGMSAIGQDFMSGWRFTVDRDRGQLRFFH